MKTDTQVAGGEGENRTELLSGSRWAGPDVVVILQGLLKISLLVSSIFIKVADLSLLQPLCFSEFIVYPSN